MTRIEGRTAGLRVPSADAIAGESGAALAADLAARVVFAYDLDVPMMAKAVLNDAQSVAMMKQTRSTLGYVPRDDAPVPLVNDPDVRNLRPAKAAQLKKLINPLLQRLLGAQEEKMPGGTMKYDGVLDGNPIKVRVDYAARDSQMIYAASIPDPERKVAVVGTSYEHCFGIGGGWNYLTEENAMVSIGLLPELLRRLVTLRNQVQRLV
jgi:hypothetical protein